MTMQFKLRQLGALCAAIFITACSLPSSPDKSGADWTLSPGASGMTYITVKNGDLAEINTFRDISGSVTASGSAVFSIALDSVDTANETRDGRMRSILFETVKFPDAVVTAQIDMAPLEALEIGASETVLLDMTISLHGIDVQKQFYIQATRLGANKVLVNNKAPLILNAGDFEFSEGLAKLQKLAGLKEITPVVPVTMSLVFER